MYKEVFIKSWKDLKENPLLFLPDTAIFLLNLILGILFLKYSGVLKLMTDPGMLAKELEAMVPVIKLFLKEHLLKVILAFLFFALTSFMIGAGLTAMKLGMMKSVIENKKLTMRKMINNGKYVWQVVSMKMIMFVIGVVTFLFVLGTGLILSAFIFKGYVIIIMGIFFPLLIIALQLLLLFRYQIMFMENKHTIIAVKESFYHLLKNKKQVFITWLITLAVSLVTAPLSAYLGFAEQKNFIISITIIAGYFLMSAMKIIIDVWSEMFRFRSYKSQV